MPTNNGNVTRAAVGVAKRLSNANFNANVKPGVLGVKHYGAGRQGQAGGGRQAGRGRQAGAGRRGRQAGQAGRRGRQAGQAGRAGRGKQKAPGGMPGAVIGAVT